jgi:predicted dehydrogenase
VLESSWALNSSETREAVTSVCGTLAGARMPDQGALEINGVKNGVMYTENPSFGAGGVAFYDGKTVGPAALEAKQWILSILNDTDPTVLPEQALVVTQILEGIYESAKTGKPYYFN